MLYPTISEYIDAINESQDVFKTQSNLIAVVNYEGAPYFSSGNFSVVFKMQDTQTGKYKAVKCFTRHQEKRKESYSLITNCLKDIESQYLVKYNYIDDELWVNSSLADNKDYPVVLMDWVEGKSLDIYLSDLCRRNDKKSISEFSYQFDRFAVWLLEQNFAHGDLKHDNIIVDKKGNITLLDYDGIFTPAMKGQRARETGSPDYVHPCRNANDFNNQIDDFPLLIISLSINLLEKDPSLFNKFHKGDNLIFKKSDFINYQESELNTELEKYRKDEIISKLSVFYNYSIIQDFCGIMGLNKVISDILKSTSNSLNTIKSEFQTNEDIKELEIPELIPYRKGDKWGFCDKNKKIIIPLIYNVVNKFSKGIAIVKKNKFCGVINNKGDEIIPFIYDNIYESDDLIQVRKNGKCGFYNLKGDVLSDCIYDDLNYVYFHFNIKEDIIYVVRNNKVGYLNKQGIEIVPCIYNESIFIYGFSEGIVTVSNGDGWVFINNKGNEVIPFIYNGTNSFSEGIAAVKKKDKWGFVNKQGIEVIPFIYDDVFSFSEGLAAVNKYDKWGYINKKGEDLIHCIYDNTKEFSEGLAAVKKDKKWGYINGKGETVISFIYDEVKSFKKGIADVYINNKWGFINKKGEELIPCIYDDTALHHNAHNEFIFSDGYDYIFSGGFLYDNISYSHWSNSHGYICSNGSLIISVEKDEKWGYINLTNTKGEEIIVCIYDDTLCFSEGLAGVKKNDKWGFINIQGLEVIPFIYDGVFSFSEGLAAVKKNNKWRYIDKTGTEYWED